jgi:hypothetical protein
MTEPQYWALLWDGDEVSRPRTIVRRRTASEHTVDEILRADGTWQTSGVLVLAELDMYEHELEPIDAAAALDFERRLAASRRPEGGDA